MKRKKRMNVKPVGGPDVIMEVLCIPVHVAESVLRQIESEKGWDGLTNMFSDKIEIEECDSLFDKRVF